jgi:hypothetical protein
MAWRGVLWMTVALTIAACGSSDSGSQGGQGGSAGSACPAVMPEKNTACSGTTEDCSYLKQDCPCGSDLYFHCRCIAGSWACGEDFDCYSCPCPAAAPDDGAACTVTGPTFQLACDYAGPPALHCVCARVQQQSAPIWSCAPPCDAGTCDSDAATDAETDAAADAPSDADASLEAASE